jgi:hypothetical protein
MSELAFNSNGDTFDVPATVTGWRVRRMKPRGAPELVYGRDGRPLVVPIESEIDDLREAVGTPGKYRLDPVNDDGKCVEGVPPAYVHVVKPERNADSAGVALAAPMHSDDSIREAMRLNTELAKAVIEKFPDMMTSAAELLRAADGAGLPARQPREIEEEEDDEIEAPPASSPAFEFINNLVAQVVPILMTGFASKKVPKLASVLDWRKASAEGRAEREQSAQPALDVTTASETTTETALPPLDPKALSHFIAIQSALAPVEAALAREVASQLSPTEMRAWFAELSALSVTDAVAKIRAFIASIKKTGGAS